MYFTILCYYTELYRIHVLYCIYCVILYRIHIHVHVLYNSKRSSPFSIVTRDGVLAIEMAESPSLSITVTSAPFDNKY